MKALCAVIHTQPSHHYTRWLSAALSQHKQRPIDFIRLASRPNWCGLTSDRLSLRLESPLWVCHDSGNDITSFPTLTQGLRCWVNPLWRRSGSEIHDIW